MSGISDQCLLCARYRGDGTCPAFPDGIPHEVWGGEHDHVEPFPGDNGFRFVARPDDLSPDEAFKFQYPEGST